MITILNIRRFLEMNLCLILIFRTNAVISEFKICFSIIGIYFQKATDIDQNFAEAYFRLAQTLDNPSEYELAYRNFETALEINPHLTECYFYFADLLARGEKLKKDGTLISEPELEKAEQNLHKAIEKDPTYHEAFYKLGKLLNKQKQFKKAYEAFKRCISIDDTYAEAHYEIALLMMNKEIKTT